MLFLLFPFASAFRKQTVLNQPRKAKYPRAYSQMAKRIDIYVFIPIFEYTRKKKTN